MKGKFTDLVGQRFGKLTVLEWHGTDNHRNATWRCRCDCGRETVVRTNALNMGHAKSCGCWGKKKPQSAVAEKKPCTGIECYAQECHKDCGWLPAEQERRKRMIYGGAMKKDENGRYGLVIKRRKTDVNAD